MGELRQSLSLVLRTADYKDNDKIITLLTKNYGRMSAKVRGAKKQTSKLFPASSLFCCGDYTFYEKSGRYGVKSCEVKSVFFNLRHDYDAFSAACLITDAVDKIAQEDNVSPGLFSLTVHALYALDTAAAPPRTVICYFLQRLLFIEGVYPCLFACVSCGAPQKSGGFSASLGGIVCPDCDKPYDSIPIDEAFVTALRSLARTAPADIGSLALDEDMSQRMSKALIVYLEHVLQKPLKTARFIKEG